MIYLLLQNPYRGFNKLKIKSVSFHSNGKIIFEYNVYNDSEILFSKMITLTNETKINIIKNASYENLNLYDSICKALVEYIVNESIEIGTIEVE